MGINAMTLALDLHTGSNKIFEHNKARTLLLIRVDDVAPVKGGGAAKRYIFQVGDAQAAVTVEGFGPLRAV